MVSKINIYCVYFATERFVLQHLKYISSRTGLQKCKMYFTEDTLKWKYTPRDSWSIREQLCLASSVLKSGDQNWISVSRSLKAMGNRDSYRSSDWFSQKSCAHQYACLLENVDVPKRKKRESGETTSETIVRRLTQERIHELSKTLPTQREEYQQLKNEVYLLKNGAISHEKLQKLWSAIEQEEKERNEKSKTQFNLLPKNYKNEKLQCIETSLVQNDHNETIDSFITDQEVSLTNTNNDDRENVSNQSSLLTSLLNSISPTRKLQTKVHSNNSPTIASLLCSSPKVPLSIKVQNTSPHLKRLIPNSITKNVKEQSYISTPTLSKLLEHANNTEKDSKSDVHATVLHSKFNLTNAPQMQNMARTRSARPQESTSMQESSVQIRGTSQTATDEERMHEESFESVHSHMDKLMQEAMPIDKDDINEIIGDIEEFIKEEITGSPQNSKSAFNKNVSIENVSHPSATIERAEPRNVDESASLSNSPTSEIAIEEIDSSSSNIAKIIGAVVETIESKTKSPNCPVANTKNNKTLYRENMNDNVIKHEMIITEVTHKATKEFKNYLDYQLSPAKLTQNEEIIKFEIIDQDILEKSKNLDEKTITTEDNQIQKISSHYLQKTLNQNEFCDTDATSEKEFLNECKTLSTISILGQIQNLDGIFVSSGSRSSNAEEKKQSDESLLEYGTHDDNVISGKNIDCTSDFGKILNEVPKVESDIMLPRETKILTSSALPKETLTSHSIKTEKTLTCNGSGVTQKTTDVDYIQKLQCLTEMQLNNVVVKEEVSQENSQDTLVLSDVKIDTCLNEYRISNSIKNELTECDNEISNNYEPNIEKDSSKNNTELKQENMESIEINELDEEEPSIIKLGGNKTIKTYSKKQNTVIDSETENEPIWENADYRAWKKSIMLVYHRLSTNKYASIFLRPITEDQAPGYHSIIFKPMDLSTIKKNIDNGTIRSTSHFQRDVMLMFQNAIMFNKYNTFVHKMTLEMQEECLQHMQILVHAAGEASFKRETRTASNTNNEANETGLKRKWSHVNFNSHEAESHKNRKRRKSETE